MSFYLYKLCDYYKHIWCHYHGIIWLICTRVSSHTQIRTISPGVWCMSTVSTVCMQQHELWTYYCVDHTPSMQVNSAAAAQTHHCNGSARTLNLAPEYDKEQTSPLTSLEARWPAGQASRNERRFVLFAWECVSMATLVCAHGTAILTNREPYELIAEHIFCALQVRTQTIIWQVSLWKILFIVYNIIA